MLGVKYCYLVIITFATTFTGEQTALLSLELETSGQRRQAPQLGRSLPQCSRTHRRPNSTIVLPLFNL